MPELVYSSKLQDLLAVDDCRTGFGGPQRKVKFTRHAADMVREACFVTEKQFGTGGCRFLTATIPGSTPQAIKVIALFSSYLTQLQNQWIRDVAPGSWVITVWELQERGALHTHTLIGVRHPGDRERICRQFQRHWRKVLCDLSESTGVDLFEKAEGGSWKDAVWAPVCRAEVIKFSVARYMSKYLSKWKQKRTTAGVFNPASWWSVSKKARLAVTKSRRATGTCSAPLAHCQLFYQVCRDTVDSMTERMFDYRNEFEPSDRFSIALGEADKLNSVFDYVSKFFTERFAIYEKQLRSTIAWMGLLTSQDIVQLVPSVMISIINAGLRPFSPAYPLPDSMSKLYAVYS